MTYNKTRRPHFSSKQRAALLAHHDFRCCWCLELILPDSEWDVEHQIARELGGSDGPDNIRPIHRDPCHRAKSRLDAKLISKSNRIRKNEGLDPVTRKPRPKMKSRNAFGQPGQKRPWPKRPFPTRRPA